MLVKAKTLNTYLPDSLDGEIGEVTEFYFDDRQWSIRYLVAETGNWLNGRRVLVSSDILPGATSDNHPPSNDRRRNQIGDTPSGDDDRSVSLSSGMSDSGCHGWPSYRGGPLTWGANSTYDSHHDRRFSPTGGEPESGDLHLRNSRDLTGCHLHGNDGEIGEVEDFLIDDKTWLIRYLVVNTRYWWLGKNILITPEWLDHLRWSDDDLFVDLSREEIQLPPKHTRRTPDVDRMKPAPPVPPIPMRDFSVR